MSPYGDNIKKIKSEKGILQGKNKTAIIILKEIRRY